MTHKDLSNFTGQELSAFTHFELSVKSLEEITQELNAYETPIPPAILSSFHKLFKSIGQKVTVKNIGELLITLKALSELAKSMTGKEDFFSACAELIDLLTAFLSNK